MQNRWNLSEDEAKRYESILSDFLKEEIDGSEINLAELGFSPYCLQKFLESKGYEAGDCETNGWEMDFWITFEKDGCKEVMLNGCGMTYELTLAYEDA